MSGKVTSASASVYTRHDSDETTIWSPRAQLSGEIERVEVEAAYAMDAWTSASIDIRTSATRAVHEVRHEFEAGGGYAFDDVTVSASYRYSTENDYWSHGGVTTLALDFAQHSTSVALSAFGAHDVVGKAGDVAFRRPLDSLGARLAWTQVIDDHSLAQVSWETTFLTGYQASPYRWVALGGESLCARETPYCVPERTPEERFRHALGARYRRALGARWSVGLGYRFYVDSWALQSHTLEPDLTLRMGRSGELKADYRYYTQNDADFYRERYRSGSSEPQYLTRDRKLSAMYSHTVGLEYLHRWLLGSGESALSFALRSSVTQYEYLAYVGLEHVRALELTGLIAFEHP